MQRRSFVKALGLAPLAASARAEPKPASGGFDELAASGAACATAAQDFLRFALTRLAARDPQLADCAAAAADAAAACDALTGLAGAETPFAFGFARTVGDVCLAAKTEAEKFPQIARCVALAQTSGACAAACRKAAG
jgi:hypothetical protein